MRYNVDYFIKKFEAIPDELWTTTLKYGKKRSALGHCGYRKTHAGGFANTRFEETEESRALTDLFSENGFDVYEVNCYMYSPYDIIKSLRTPKARILGVLYFIKNKKK